MAKFWKQGRIRIAFIGLENQTEIEADMPLRVVSYDGAVYRDQMNGDKTNEAKERYPVVTLVLYFGYKKRWNKPLRLKECFVIPKALEPFVNDYRVNLFEIAWLPDETIQKFQSDFRLVADYFSQKRKNKAYDPPGDTIRHVRETLELLSALMKDTRFIDAYNEKHEEGREDHMDAWLTEIENRGIARGVVQGMEQGKEALVQNFVAVGTPIEYICKATGWTEETVRRVARVPKV